MTIKFYKTRETYGCFSNFSRHTITLDSRTWATTEHYFQAQKFVGTPRYDQIANAATPRIAADLGRDRGLPLRADWEQVKDEVMLKCIREKVLQHVEIKKLLMGTGDAEIIEDSPVDWYWGCGKDGTGRNQLGKALMIVRDELYRTEGSLGL